MTTIKISRNMLLGALLRLRHTFLRKNALPIMSDYLFEIGDGGLEVTSSDGETVTTVRIPLGEEAVTHEGEQRMRFCVFRHFLLQAVKALDEQDLTINVLDYQIRIVHADGQFGIGTEDASEYPVFAFPSSDQYRHSMSVETPGLSHWLETLSFAVSKDMLRPVMNGIVFNFTGGNLELAASDGHRLVRIRKSSVGIEKNANIIINKKTIDILSSVLPKTGHVDFCFNEYLPDEKEPKRAESMFCINYEDGCEMKIYSRGIEGRYPNYNSVIPARWECAVRIDRRNLIKILNRTMIFTNSSDMIRLRLEEGLMELSCGDTDEMLDCKERIPAEVVDGTLMGLPFGLKAQMLQQCLHRLQSGSVLLKVTDPSRAVILEPEPQPDVEEITMLIMPMLIND